MCGPKKIRPYNLMADNPLTIKLSEIKNYEDKILKLNILKKDLEIATINLKNKHSLKDGNKIIA